MTKIHVTTTFEGVHFWKEAPVQVAFLRNEHRHLFHVTISVRVGHPDRSLEFFIVKDNLDQLIDSLFPAYHPGLPRTKQLGPRSCEHVASLLFEELSKTYGGRSLEVSVSEDGENSASVWS